MTFEYQQTVRFQHCDPAGIVFYPRYMEMVNSCVEAWFEEHLGHSYNKLHVELNIGVPTVHLETNFVRASRLEERLSLWLTLKKLGDKSMTLAISIQCAGEVRAEVTVTLVLVNLTSMQSMTWQSMPPLFEALMSQKINTIESK